MNNEEYGAVMETVIELCRCAVNKEIPEKEKLDHVNLDLLYEAANKHLLTAAVGMALESTDIKTEKFTQAIAQAQRKNALLDADRMMVLSEMEKAGIWYMPLKGSVLKDMYPRYGMRQMADNDILFEPERRADLREIMENLGFTTEHFNQSNHDVYHKKPVSNFEMHVSLFQGDGRELLEAYYFNIKERLLKEERNKFGYQFSDEDFYIYIVAHEYKHYKSGGTGLRSLLDTYVYLKSKQSKIDWKYIQQETAKMDISGFEESNRMLATHLFEGQELSESENQMLQYILSSGVYGNLENETKNLMDRKGGKWGFLLARMTLPKEDMYGQYPILKRKPYLYPVMWVWRFIHGFFTNRGKFVYQVKAALGLVKFKD